MANVLMAISHVLRINDVQAVDGMAKAAQTGGRAAQAQGPATAESDRADLSGQGEVLRSAMVTLRSLSTFRSGQVAELRARIAAGNYQPDPTEVAQVVGKALHGAMS